MQEAPDKDRDQNEPPSKSSKKRDMTALQELGAQLVELNEQQIASMQLPEALLDAVLEAKRLNRREAKRRQMQYIGRLMRDIDAAPIRERLEQWRGQGREHTAQLHAIERWRDELLAADPALQRFLDEHPGADSQKLRTLVRNARREQSAALPPKSYRELFRALRETIDKETAADAQSETAGR
ncbi:MAG TPA: ribosome biogenesis factor YjgA [Burkholderiales bacterium]|nr:ribosome biogenesis factor YjgA [Burkholderiales bacterium]